MVCRMKEGRPTKYDPAYCDAIVAFCADGSSLSSFAASLRVGRSTLTEWSRVHPEFLSAVKAAKAQVAAWYDKTARNVAENGGGNATLCIFGLKNFDEEDFRDKQELETPGLNDAIRSITRRVVDSAHD
jgi:hypothetical protein